MTVHMLALALLLSAPSQPAAVPADVAAAPASPTLGYADMADLALSAPIAAVVDVRRATRLGREQQAGVAPGRTRFFVEGDVVSLVKGRGGLTAQVRFLIDLPNDARGRPARPRDQRLILFARPVEGRPGEIQLVGDDAQLPWTAADEAQLRAILTQAVAADAPPAITGIASAFSVAGTLPGESESQIFVQTATREPMTLSVLRRPGETPRWSVSASEIVDESAGAPDRDTLLWYRLACGLPTSLPDRVLNDPATEARLREDYRLVVDSLGPCGRQRERSSTPTPAQSG